MVARPRIPGADQSRMRLGMPRLLLPLCLIALLALIYLGLRYLDAVYVEVYGDPELPEGFSMEPPPPGR